MSQQKKAADYLFKINPKRYYWERYEDYLHLIDRKSPTRHHSRNACQYTQVVSYWGKVPLYGFLVVPRR